MTKHGIIEELLVRNPAISYRESETLVSVMFEAMARELTTGHRIELRGFGSFGIKLRRARQARNPKTGAPVDVAPRRAPFFRVGKELRVKLNGPATGESQSPA
ncbi:MAG: integration host factor subunit beta [Deltaproteobacteria bacterium]|nr:integration host factor subunit beta [Deltaproteobacteria bacterium]